MRYMQICKWMTTALLLATGVINCLAEELTIHTFGKTGQLGWNEIGSATNYRIEWASSPAGPWTNTWEGLDSIEPSGTGSIWRCVPMCYRVVALVTNDWPVIDLEGDLAFGDVIIGSTAIRTLSILNRGVVDLHVSGIDYPEGFRGDWSGIVKSGDSKAVSVTFAPSAEMTYGGDVSVSSDSVGGTSTRSISGNGVPPIEGFVLVEAGTAAGGSPTITNDFFIAKYEVTNEQMRDVLQWAYNQGGLITANSSTVRNAPGNEWELLNLDDGYCQLSFSDGTFSVESGKDNYPCVMVSWYGAAAYCNYLSAKEGLTPAYDIATGELVSGADGCRLPSEWEWEYAARGGKDGNDTVYSGSDIIGDVAWYADNSNAPGNSDFADGHGTLPVGGKASNELGTFDMSGNVWEWCHGWYTEGTQRTRRGGCWDNDSSRCGVSVRAYDGPVSSGKNYLGFRPILPAVQ